jgi:hypothetical protein
MSKTDDTSKLDRVKIETRVLADSELDAVTGGWLPTGIPGVTAPSVSRHPHYKMVVEGSLKQA